MLISRWRRWLLFQAAMDLDQPLKFMCALAALFYPTFSHCSRFSLKFGPLDEGSRVSPLVPIW
jgi:hypothetical protein